MPSTHFLMVRTLSFSMFLYFKLLLFGKSIRKMTYGQNLEPFESPATRIIELASNWKLGSNKFLNNVILFPIHWFHFFLFFSFFPSLLLPLHQTLPRAHMQIWKAYLSLMPWGPCSSFRDLLCQGRDVSSLLIKNHI